MQRKDGEARVVEMLEKRVRELREEVEREN